MKKESLKRTGILSTVFTLLIPLPTYALGGSEQLWASIFSVVIVGTFLILSFFPWLTYRAIKGGSMFWVIVTIILCSVGIYYSSLICSVLFEEPDWVLQRFLTNLLSSSVYGLLFFKTLQKATEQRANFNDVQSTEIAIDVPQDDELQASLKNIGLFRMYRRLNVEHEAVQLTDLLKRNNIEYMLEDHSPASDIIFSTNAQDREFWVKIKKEDFERADRVQLDYLNSFIETIDKDYYLFTFSNSELWEIVAKRDEWSKLDFLLAQKILRDRGENQTELKP